jgi:hypothetical protein
MRYLMTQVNYNLGVFFLTCSGVSVLTSAALYLSREYFVLTDAGKPVFTR